MHGNIPKAYVGACLKNLHFFGALSVPYFIDWLRVDYTRLFALQAWFLFWVFVLEIPTGIVADKFGRRLSVALGCLLFAADILVFGLGARYWVLFASEVVGAAGLTLMSGAEEALFYDTLVAVGEREHARHYISRVGVAATLGLLVAFPAGTFIAGRGVYPESLLVPFVMTAAASTLAAFVYASMKEPDRVKPTEGFLRMGLLGLRTLFMHPELRGYVLNAVTIAAVTFLTFWFYQPVARRAGMPLAYIGVLAAGFNLFSTIVLANSTLLERAMSTRTLLLATAVIPAVMFAVLAWTRSLALVVPALFLLVACKVVRGPVLAALINRHIESRNRATVISSMSLLERAIIFILYPIAGFLADRSLDLALYTLAVVCAVFAISTRLSKDLDLDARQPRGMAAGS